MVHAAGPVCSTSCTHPTCHVNPANHDCAASCNRPKRTDCAGSAYPNKPVDLPTQHT
ncbi:hypothetical protein BDV93DRAFT_524385 [Ceratobasidium sp. AG-I]|nr:hypothetical protein BDV93DRAFT_524385 [Ceratobasidium sp. AG-I]